MKFSSASRTGMAVSILVLAAVIGFLQGGTAHGQQDLLWGAKMFEVTEIKFGSVAKGADSAVQLKVKNIYKEDIQITNLTTGCGCVSWDEVRENKLPLVIPSGQQTVLTLRLDTIRYDGERKSKAIVTLLDPVHGVSTTVDFPVYAFIRRDIVITPGAVNFGTVDLGIGAERKVAIHYAGREDWKLMQARASNPNLNVALRETVRGNGLVNYELTVTLKEKSPVGIVRDQVIIETDDVNNPRVSVLVEGKVEADIAITDLQFGALAPGQAKTVPVIIRGRKPFRIDELYREKKDGSLIQDDAFKVKLNKATSTVHSLPVTFTAPDVPGAFEEDFYIKIADRPQPILVKVRGRIIEQTGAAKQ
jgi:hypothetical protein